MRVVVLTSSRADFGIYLPLLKLLQSDDYFNLKIVAFGTHLSRFHGYTIDQIEKSGFTVSERLETLILGDTEEAISNAIGNTITKFSSLWQKLKGETDLIIALGDRYEMFAAVAASVPFNINIAHLHGGETTLGAIDNKFRHSISLMSSLHFVSTVDYAKRVADLMASSEGIYNVGALSLDNIVNLNLLSKSDFKDRFNIDLDIPTILTTFHPETVSVNRNIDYADILVNVFSELSTKYQIVITMPNADTMGNIIREKFQQLVKSNKRIIGIENFGTLGYFSCIQNCSFLLGNTSSGIIEAASFGKYVINLGDRQKGRATSDNIFNTEINKRDILRDILLIEAQNYEYKGNNVYRKVDCAQSIINALKERYV